MIFFAATYFCFLASSFSVAAMKCPEKYTSCQVTGHSADHDGKKYLVQCASLAGAFEYKSDAETAAWTDPISGHANLHCRVKRDEWSQLTKSYDAKLAALENPKCTLNNVNGQLAYRVESAHGRCSFKMNEKKAHEFQKATGVTPVYQCEDDYFLTVPGKQALAIYRRKAQSWELACEAIPSSTPSPAIDWDHSSFYEP